MVTLTKPAAPPKPAAQAAPPKPALITAEEFMRMDDSEGVRAELIRGAVCEAMGTGFRHTIIAGRFVRHLGSFVEERLLGFAGAPDGGVRLERDPDTVRIPDAMFVSNDRLPSDDDLDFYIESTPNIAVEVKSRTDSVAQTHDKARMWHAHGVPLVWAAYPETRTIDVHSADGSITTLTDADTLDGGEVLPGFSVAVSDIFDIKQGG